MDNKENVFEKLKAKLVDLATETGVEVGETSSDPPPASCQVMATDHRDRLTETRSTRMSSFFDICENSRADRPLPRDAVRRDLSLYKEETPISMTECPLDWWRCHAAIYPTLSRLAKCYLSVPATSVPSERVFSAAGNIVTSQRSRLDPNNVDMLIFLNKNTVH